MSAQPQLFGTPEQPSPQGEPARLPDRTCRVCGARASYGFGVSLLKGKPGRWSCFQHQAQVERMPS